MKLLVYGMMRSGTTLICDLLSVPNRSLIFHEPMMFDPWRDQRAREIHAVAKAFGLPVPEVPPEEQQFGIMANYFERVLEPHLEGLDFWGFKEVSFHDWRRVLARYQPEKLILCVRDIRDITLSALDLIVNSELAFTGGQKMRDEAWLVGRLCFDVHELLLLQSHPHFLVRYEDLVSHEQSRAQLAAFAGLEQLSDQALHRNITTRGSRKREVEKHGPGISSRSIARFERETGVQALALANHIFQLLPEYATAFGYAQPSTPSSDTKPTRIQDSPPSWREIEDWRSPGPTHFDPAFALRRARRVVAQNIRPKTRVVELGCLLPVLRYQLPEGCFYLGLGDKARRPAIQAADWAQGTFPDLSSADLLAVIGSLEFVEDVKTFVSSLQATGKEVLLTYHATEDTEGLDRPSFGWRNHLGRRDLISIFEQSGYSVTKSWNFDGCQSLFRLQP